MHGVSGTVTVPKKEGKKHPATESAVTAGTGLGTRTTNQNNDWSIETQIAISLSSSCLHLRGRARYRACLAMQSSRQNEPAPLSRSESGS